MFKGTLTKMTLNSDYTNINRLNVAMLSYIQKDLPLYDLCSLVFLLYDVPATALQDVMRLETVADPSSLSLLRDWALNAMKADNIEWKFKLTEALVECRLFMVIRKLGMDTNEVRSFFKQNMFIHPIKKIMYQMCEHINTKTLFKLRKSFETFNIVIINYQTCESLFLDLMVQKVIDVDTLSGRYEISKLINVLKAFPTLDSFCKDLDIINEKRDVNCLMTNNCNIQSSEVTRNMKGLSDTEDAKLKQKFAGSNFDELVENLKLMTISDVVIDTKQSYTDSYKIKNPMRVGTCYIINEEEFYPSKQSQCKYLEDREGSIKDKKKLIETFQELNFTIKISENLTYEMFLQSIIDVVEHTVHPDDSIFVLCIMSHGIKGHIYTSDSMPVSIQDVQNVLSSKKLHNIPKVMILQACQSNYDHPPATLMSDSPNPEFLGKSDFIIYWATAPELEAFRDTKKGSIFIQLLCFMVDKYASQENLYDIITKVTNAVTTYCACTDKIQVPLFESTLRKKLYLKMSMK